VRSSWSILGGEIRIARIGLPLEPGVAKSSTVAINGRAMESTIDPTTGDHAFAAAPLKTGDRIAVRNPHLRLSGLPDLSKL
jgi:hypothetical protein